MSGTIGLDIAISKPELMSICYKSHAMSHCKIEAVLVLHYRQQTPLLTLCGYQHKVLSKFNYQQFKFSRNLQ